MRRSPAASGAIHPCDSGIELSTASSRWATPCFRYVITRRNGDATASSPMILRKYTLVCEMFSIAGVSLPNAPTHRNGSGPQGGAEGVGGWPWGPA